MPRTTARLQSWLTRRWVRPASEELIQAYRVTFSTLHGQLVLQHLLNEVYCQTCPEHDPLALATHNGRRTVVQEILENIERAEAVRPFPHEQEQLHG